MCFIKTPKETASSSASKPAAHTPVVADTAATGIPVITATAQAAAASGASASVGGGGAADDEEKALLRSQITDLTEKLETLKLKRAEDREKLREYDRSKVHTEQASDLL